MHLLLDLGEEVPDSAVFELEIEGGVAQAGRVVRGDLNVAVGPEPGLSIPAVKKQSRQPSLA